MEDDYAFVYENTAVEPAEMVLKMGDAVRQNAGGGESNQDAL
jgi:hypothetical protein